jgi:predicted transcriptional regulator YheO
MKKRELVTLDLNAEIVALVRERLRTFGEIHDEHYDEVLCGLKELNTDIVHEVHGYLLKRGSGSLLSKTAQITGISRKSVYNYLKK